MSINNEYLTCMQYDMFKLMYEMLKSQYGLPQYSTKIGRVIKCTHLYVEYKLSSVFGLNQFTQTTCWESLNSSLVNYDRTVDLATQSRRLKVP